MMRRRFATLTLLAGLATLAACGTTDSTAPAVSAGVVTGPLAQGTYHDGFLVPGSNGQSGETPSQAGSGLQCSVLQPLSGSALIGPSGGVLTVGPHRLIVPAGALTSDVTISATVPADTMIKIDFEPHGLHFKKPAGLILDASSCGTVPNAVYLDEIGGDEHIVATYSNWWHAIAAPIDHFSGYALDM